MKKIALLGVVAVIGLSACTDANQSVTPVPNAGLNFEALQRASDIEVMNSFGVALNIAQRCPSVMVNKRMLDLFKPTMNRVVLFGGKAKIKAGFETAKAAFATKYGKPLLSETSHCDAAQREMREISPTGAFLKSTS